MWYNGYSDLLKAEIGINALYCIFAQVEKIKKFF